jgi:hypothetical protein
MGFINTLESNLGGAHHEGFHGIFSDTSLFSFGGLATSYHLHPSNNVVSFEFSQMCDLMIRSDDEFNII